MSNELWRKSALELAEGIRSKQFSSREVIDAHLARIDEDQVRCADPEASAAMVKEIEAAHKDGDTLGGVVEVIAFNVPVGLGSHVHWDRRLEDREEHTSELQSH